MSGRFYCEFANVYNRYINTRVKEKLLLQQRSTGNDIGSVAQPQIINCFVQGHRFVRSKVAVKYCDLPMLRSRDQRACP